MQISSDDLAAHRRHGLERNCPVEKLVHDPIDADDVVAKGFNVLSDKNSDKMKILINSQPR
jgi:hypothetical protein